MDAIRFQPPQVPTQNTPPPPGAPASQPQPSATDRVTLQQGEAPGYSYKHEQDGQGVQYQTWSAKSGAKYEVASKGEEKRFHVELPGGLTGAPIEISGGATAGQPTQLVAHAGPLELPVQMADGKYMISLASNGTVAMFDPTSMDFGVASPPQQQQGPNGQPMIYQALQEVVHADNSHTVKAHATVSEGVQGGGMSRWGQPQMGVPTRETQYLQIDTTANGKVSAKQVVERQTPNAQPNRQESAVSATRQQDGSFAIGGGSLMSHMKSSLQNPFTLQSPLMSWMKSRKQPNAVIPTFSSNPGLIATLGAAAGPTAAMAAQMPFAGNVPPPPGFPR